MLKEHYGNTSKWLKSKSQKNRANRFQQLELDFGSEFEKTTENQPTWKEHTFEEDR